MLVSLLIFCILGWLLYLIVVQENIFNKVCMFIIELIILYIYSRILMG